MANNGTQDPAAYNVFVGEHLVTGFATGDSYNRTFDKPAIQTVSGNNGLGAFAVSRGQPATMTIELLSTSNDNDVFSNLLAVDKGTVGGFAFAFFVKDFLGATVETARVCHFEQFADESRGDAINTRLWTIKTTNLETFMGGNLPSPVITAEGAAELVGNLPPILPKPI